MNRSGHIELERSLDSIQIGSRHRNDFGDIEALAESIRVHGLLQPLTITPEGVLVCGARRLAALRSLDIRTINVWVRAGVSDRLSQLLAQQDENLLHKPLTPTESASLYAELKALLTEDAARRQEATRFGREPSPSSSHGAANVAAPWESHSGDSRVHAAMLITGRRSYTTLERIRELQRIADDANTDTGLRESAQTELRAIDEGAPVMPAVRRVTEQRAIEGRDRVRNVDEQQPPGLVVGPASTPAVAETTDSDSRALLPTRAFVYLWKDLADWWTRYDVNELAAELTDAQCGQFEDVVEGTGAFAGRLRTVRGLLVDAPSAR